MIEFISQSQPLANLPATFRAIPCNHEKQKPQAQTNALTQFGLIQFGLIHLVWLIWFDWYDWFDWFDLIDMIWLIWLVWLIWFSLLAADLQLVEECKVTFSQLFPNSGWWPVFLLIGSLFCFRVLVRVEIIKPMKQCRNVLNPSCPIHHGEPPMENHG